MSPSETTLADSFSRAGYRTLYLGKWHLFGSTQEGWVAPSHRGRFDYWEGWEARVDNHFSTKTFLGPGRENRDYQGFQTDVMTSRAIEILTNEAKGKEPFFFAVSVEPPHPPYTAPKEYSRQWQGVDF